MQKLKDVCRVKTGGTECTLNLSGKLKTLVRTIQNNHWVALPAPGAAIVSASVDSFTVGDFLYSGTNAQYQFSAFGRKKAYKS